jgi:cold-inducible RNA-binding protein
MTTKRLFVGNLPFGTKETDVQDFFDNCGHPLEEATIITDRMTGQSKGFAFVTLTSDGDPNQAIKEMNGRDFNGRALTVNTAHPKQPHGYSEARRAA